MVAVVNGRAVEAIQTGGKTGFRTTEAQVEFKDGVLRLPGFDYKPEDSSCCPSEPKTRKFKIVDGAFVENEN